MVSSLENRDVGLTILKWDQMEIFYYTEISVSQIIDNFSSSSGEVQLCSSLNYQEYLQVISFFDTVQLILFYLRVNTVNL